MLGKIYDQELFSAGAAHGNIWEQRLAMMPASQRKRTKQRWREEGDALVRSGEIVPELKPGMEEAAVREITTLLSGTLPANQKIANIKAMLSGLDGPAESKPSSYNRGFIYSDPAVATIDTPYRHIVPGSKLGPDGSVNSWTQDPSNCLYCDIPLKEAVKVVGPFIDHDGKHHPEIPTSYWFCQYGHAVSWFEKNSSLWGADVRGVAQERSPDLNRHHHYRGECC